MGKENPIHPSTTISRRAFLAEMGALASLGLLASCAQQPAAQEPETAPAATPRPTQIALRDAWATAGVVKATQTAEARSRLIAARDEAKAAATATVVASLTLENGRRIDQIDPTHKAFEALKARRAPFERALTLTGRVLRDGGDVGPALRDLNVGLKEVKGNWDVSAVLVSEKPSGLSIGEFAKETFAPLVADPRIGTQERALLYLPWAGSSYNIEDIANLEDSVRALPGIKEEDVFDIVNATLIHGNREEVLKTYSSTQDGTLTIAVVLHDQNNKTQQTDIIDPQRINEVKELYERFHKPGVTVEAAGIATLAAVVDDFDPVHISAMMTRLSNSYSSHGSMDNEIFARLTLIAVAYDKQEKALIPGSTSTSSSSNVRRTGVGVGTALVAAGIAGFVVGYNSRSYLKRPQHRNTTRRPVTRRR